jgi:ATP-binding cassette, subfamily B, bacterial
MREPSFHLPQVLRVLSGSLRLVWQSNRVWVVVNTGLVVAGSILSVSVLYITRLLIDELARTSATPSAAGRGSSALWLIAALGGLGFTVALVRSLSGMTAELLNQDLKDHVYQLIHAKSVELDLAHFESPRFHDTLHRAALEAPTRPAQITDSMMTILGATVSLLGVGSILLSFRSWVVPLLVMAAVPALGGQVTHAARLDSWLRRKTRETRRAWYADSVLTNRRFAKEVRAFGLGPTFAAMFRTSRAALSAEQLEVARRRVFAEVLTQGVEIAAVTSLLVLLVREAAAGAITIGYFVMYLQALYRGRESLSVILAGVSSVYRNSRFLTSFYELMAMTPVVRDPPCPVAVERRGAAALEFDCVSYRYPGAERLVLEDVSLTIRPGEHVAFVGKNGAGKSTLVKLILRLYDPDSGTIRVDGVDVRDVKVVDHRQRLAVLFDDFARFHLSVEENVRLGDIRVPPHSPEIREACRRSGAASFAATLPHGYDTFLGNEMEDGQDLSSGEWQKLALARAFLRDAPLIILDEPASSLDPEAEALFVSNLRRLAEGRTVVVISHRLSTVRHVNRIFVLENSRIQQVGSHDELTASRGAYTRLFCVLPAHHS